MAWRTKLVMLGAFVGGAAMLAHRGGFDPSAVQGMIQQASDAANAFGALQQAQEDGLSTGDADVSGILSMLSGSQPAGASGETRAPGPRPRLTATMHGRRGWLAVIDGAPVQVGEIVGEARLVETGHQYAILEHPGGERETLHLGVLEASASH